MSPTAEAVRKAKKELPHLRRKERLLREKCARHRLIQKMRRTTGIAFSRVNLASPTYAERVKSDEAWEKSEIELARCKAVIASAKQAK